MPGRNKKETCEVQRRGNSSNRGNANQPHKFMEIDPNCHDSRSASQNMSHQNSFP